MRRRWATASAVLAVAAVSGCGSTLQPKTEAFDPAAVTSSPTPSPTASESAAILAAYREFFARQTEISMAPVDQRRALLETFTADPALSSVLRGMRAATESGQVGYGSGVLDPRVTAVSGAQATVEDCQDNSETGQKVAKTDKITTRGPARDHAVTTMRRGPDAVWRVSFVDFPESPC